MTATAAQIAQVRRMTSEPTEDTYSDEAVQGYIEEYPTVDERGTDPYWWNSATTPPTRTANVDWIATYDLHAAAADIWEEKAAALSAGYDFATEGQSFTRSQAYEQAMKMARFHKSQRNPDTIVARMKPDTKLTSEVIGNLAEQDESWQSE